MQTKNHELQAYGEECVRKFVGRFSTEEIMAKFMELWATYYPKNHRIMTSSPAILAGIRQKFDQLKNQ
ncbi:MAG: hypothetical protein IPL28_11890 [Chloroflexi bacterium]|nr:hypothetical protein [Chloroflexota bacterium]